MFLIIKDEQTSLRAHGVTLTQVKFLKKNVKTLSSNINVNVNFVINNIMI